MEIQKDSVEDKLITSFNDQFATNQNHAQVIFIQFMSAILVVLIGYGYVYANTLSSAFLFDAYKTDDKIISFSIIHLLGTFFIAELILTMLATVILNTGYGFRRDQFVIYKIRQQHMQDRYGSIFGNASFNPRNKTLNDFLPEFSRSFFFGILTLQILLLLSYYYAKSQFICYPSFDSYNIFWKSVFLMVSHLIYFIPLIWTLFVFQNAFKKYYWIMTDTHNYWLPRYRKYRKVCRLMEESGQNNHD